MSYKNRLRSILSRSIYDGSSVSHEDIATRAYEIYQSGKGESAEANWYQAERELLAYHKKTRDAEHSKASDVYNHRKSA